MSDLVVLKSDKNIFPAWWEEVYASLLSKAKAIGVHANHQLSVKQLPERVNG